MLWPLRLLSVQYRLTDGTQHLSENCSASCYSTILHLFGGWNNWAPEGYGGEGLGWKCFQKKKLARLIKNNVCLDCQ